MLLISRSNSISQFAVKLAIKRFHPKNGLKLCDCTWKKCLLLKFLKTQALHFGDGAKGLPDNLWKHLITRPAAEKFVFLNKSRNFSLPLRPLQLVDCPPENHLRPEITTRPEFLLAIQHNMLRASVLQICQLCSELSPIPNQFPTGPCQTIKNIIGSPSFIVAGVLS